MALTADEEGGKSNGVDWLLKNHRDLIDAEFVLNPDSGGVTSAKGKIVNVDIEASEKLYADYELTATNPGGHSSLPVPDNAIYHLVDACRDSKRVFPLELNDVTRTYFERRAPLESGQTKRRHERPFAHSARPLGGDAAFPGAALQFPAADYLRPYAYRRRTRQ